jgi:hypothetical protein
MQLNELMQGGFSGRSGPAGDMIEVAGRRYLKTPQGWQDVETGEIADAQPQASSLAKGTICCRSLLPACLLVRSPRRKLQQIIEGSAKLIPHFHNHPTMQSTTATLSQ